MQTLLFSYCVARTSMYNMKKTNLKIICEITFSTGNI